MNLSDTFYVALCMTVLILGVVYWFWTQNQYIQRKLNLLENIVFEMKTQISNLASAPDNLSMPTMPAGLPVPGLTPTGLAPATYAPAPADDEDDLLHEDLHAQASPLKEDDFTDMPTPVANVLVTPSAPSSPVSAEGDDLQPGGVGSGVEEKVMPDSTAGQGALDGMTLKELRRLAEIRGVSGATHLRKQQLIDALRILPSEVKPYNTSESTLDLS